MSDFVFLKKPIFWLVIFLGLLLAAVIQWPRNELQLIFCDVGQGDAALIVYKNSQILIDGGPNEKVLNCLADHMPFWDRKIEIVILSHPEKDHFGGLIGVFEGYGVEKLVAEGMIASSSSSDSLVIPAKAMPAGRQAGIQANAGLDSPVKLENDMRLSPALMKFRDLVSKSNAEIIVPRKGDTIKIGGLSLFFLWPTTKLGDASFWKKENLAGIDSANSVLGEADFNTDVNEASVTVKVSFGNFDALFAGDLTSKEEDQLGVGDIEVLKVSHHGSKFSSGEEFLKKVKPELAVISVGKNSYGHPTPEVLGRLGVLGIKYLRTDKNGEVALESDGKGFKIQDL